MVSTMIKVQSITEVLKRTRGAPPQLGRGGMCKSSQQRWHLNWTLKGSDGQRWREDIPGKRNHVSQGQEVRRCRAHSVKGGMGVCDSLRLVGWDQNPKSLESHAGKFTLDSTGNVEPSDVFAHGCNMFPLGRLDVCFTAAVLSQKYLWRAS